MRGTTDMERPQADGPGNLLQSGLAGSGYGEDLLSPWSGVYHVRVSDQRSWVKSSWSFQNPELLDVPSYRPHESMGWTGIVFFGLIERGCLCFGHVQ